MTENMTQAELEKIHAEINKMMAETAKIQRETVLYPLVVGAGLMGAAMALIKVI